jgi:type II secretory pathway pseudopilin PulG
VKSVWHRMRGFSLVELTLAIGVAAFCFIAVFGLIPVGVQTNRNATSQTQATSIIALAIADLRATQIGPQYGSPLFGFFPIPTDPTSPPQFVAPDFVPCSGGQTSTTSQSRYIDSQGQSGSSPTSTSRYRLTVTFVKNTTATSTTGALYVHLKVTWPAAAGLIPIDPCAVTPSGSVETFAALDRN